ncbi:MAG: TonB-dependent receptor domain-containing protein [Steroidobacteraceae bacterium]
MSESTRRLAVELSRLRRIYVGLSGLIMLIGATTAQAQQAGLAISVVSGADGEPVSEARIVVENVSIGLRQDLRTGLLGQARLAGLPSSGEYTVALLADDGETAVRSTPLELRNNFVRAVTLIAPPARLDTVVVEGARNVSSLNQINAEVSATLDQRELAELPIEGRDLLRALARLPNVVPSTGFFPEAPPISINGANGLTVSYLIDGLDSNENFLGGQKFPVPLGAARDVTVLANNFPAEFGRSATGIVNVTSRGGGNEFESEFFTLLRPGQPFDSRSAFAQRDLSGNPVGSDFERLQGGYSIGGPLVRDRSFLFGNVEYTEETNRTVLDAPSVGAVDSLVGRNRFLLASSRLDHHFHDRWIGTLRGNLGRVSIERPGGSLGGGSVQFPSAGSDQDRDSAIVAASLAYAADTWNYQASLLWSAFDWDYGEPRQTGPQVVARDSTGLAVAIVGHPGFVFDSREQTIQTQHKVEFARGAHRLAFGTDLLQADFDLQGGGNPDGNFVVDLTDSQIADLRELNLGSALGADDILRLDPAVSSYGVELRPASFGRPQRLAALYFEDEWQIGARLTATLGLRWDYDSLTGEGGSSDDLDNFGPRFSLNFRPDERNALRFGAGIFYDKLTYAVISDALQRNTTSGAFLTQLQQLIDDGALPADTNLDRVTFDGNLTVNPACTTVSACPPSSEVQTLRDTAVINEARILSPRGYDSPYASQFALGWQRQIDEGWSGSVDLIYNRSHDLVRLRDLNAPLPFSPDAAALTDAVIAELRALPDNAARLARAQELGLVRSQADADASRPVALVPGGARQITVSETAGNATYRALNLALAKARGADAWAARLSYTLSKLTNDTDDINFRASNANDFAADAGPSANDRRHVISLFGSYYIGENFALTAAGLFQSGQPVNRVPDASVFGTQDLNGDGASFGENFIGNSDRYPGERRNAGRLSWSKTVDLGARYRFRLARTELEISADVFNVFNENNSSGFANSATTSNQIQFGGGAPFVQRNAGPPRQFQFGVTGRF